MYVYVCVYMVCVCMSTGMDRLDGVEFFVRNFVKVMAQVILPYGYPVISGEGWSSLVYQGTVVRLYADAADPRTDSQNFERALFGDLKRLISSAGMWPKSSWRFMFGTRWSSIVYQMARGNVDGYWNFGLSAFDGINLTQKNLWRASAPYQATYNDPGRVWYAYLYMLYQWATSKGINNFKMVNPIGANAASMLVWWQAGLDKYGFQENGEMLGFVPAQLARWKYVGAWSNDGMLRMSSTPGDYAEITLVNSQVQFLLYGGTDGANVEVKLNGSQIGFCNTNLGGPGGTEWNDVWRTPATRVYRLYHVGTSGQKIRVDALSYGCSYGRYDLDAMIGGWQSYSSGGPPESEKWKSTGAGARAIEFNFVGAYIYAWFDRGVEYGMMRIIIDGVEYGTIDLSVVGGGVIPQALFGRFRSGLHRCRIEAVGAAQINFWRFTILRSKKGTGL